MSDLDQRTLPPTQRRIDEFRKRGELARSRELTAAATLAGGAIGGLLYADATTRALAGFMQETVGALHAAQPTLASIGRVLAAATLPSAVGALVGYVVTAAIQVGTPATLRSPTFDLSRVLSLNGLVQLLNPKAMATRTLLALAKLGFVLAAALLVLRAAQTEFFASPALDARSIAMRLGLLAVRLFSFAGGALVLLAVGEYLHGRYQLMRRMRMTPQEMKREHREQEGDPQIKRRRRQRMRELAKRRLSAVVKTADVVVVNPTEYAVALRYRSAEDRAPRVVAKGRGPVAERIRELARTAGVPILPQPPLARLLHKTVPEGREIPSTLYKAVAEVLAYVYRLQRRNR